MVSAAIRIRTPKTIIQSTKRHRANVAHPCLHTAREEIVREIEVIQIRHIAELVGNRSREIVVEQRQKFESAEFAYFGRNDPTQPASVKSEILQIC